MYLFFYTLISSDAVYGYMGGKPVFPVTMKPL
jgi:hypothetical protein